MHIARDLTLSQYRDEFRPNPRDVAPQTAQKPSLVLTKVDKLLGMSARGLEFDMNQCAEFFLQRNFSFRYLAQLPGVPTVPAREDLPRHFIFAAEMAVYRYFANVRGVRNVSHAGRIDPIAGEKGGAAAIIAGRFVLSLC